MKLIEQVHSEAISLSETIQSLGSGKFYLFDTKTHLGSAQKTPSSVVFLVIRKGNLRRLSLPGKFSTFGFDLPVYDNF